jgi:hypothetical protein
VNRRHHFRAALLVLATISPALPAAAVELVSNGGFETGDFAGWTQFGGLNQTNVNVNDAVIGSFGARFSPNSPGGIHQDIATVAGTSYLVSFDLRRFANLLAPNNFFTAEFDGVVLTSITNAGALPLTSYSFTPVAGGAVSQLRFTFRDNRNGPVNRWSIDNISVSEITPAGGVPEPASWAMLLAGFVLVGAVARRRRLTLGNITA